MITPSHLIYSWALGKWTEKVPNPGRLRLFVLGGFLPDVPVYVFFIVHGLLLGTSGQLMWDDMYFDSAWTPFFTLSHSLILWPLALLLGYWLRIAWLRYIATAGVLHVILDFFVHHDDAYRHFWPLFDWKFASPLSYYDPAFYGTQVGIIDAAVVVALLVWLLHNTSSRLVNIVIFGCIGLYILIAISAILRL